MDKLALNGVPDVWARIAALRCRDESPLAPKFRAIVDATLAECQYTTVAVMPNGQRALLRLDAVINETLRTNELQQIYFQQGTTKAATAEHSWHFYGLAVDVISAKYEWFDNAAAKYEWPSATARAAVGSAWFRAVGEIAIRRGLQWGGTWHTPDMPHLQYGTLHDSPLEAPSIYAAAGGGDAGRRAVWAAVGA